MKGIIFDMDGVVIDNEPLWSEAEIKLLERRGKKYDRRLKPQLMGLTNFESMKKLAKHYGLNEPVESLVKERLDIMKYLTEEKLQWMPGFLEFLRRAKAVGFRCAIATSSPKELVEAVEARLGLKKFVSVVITAERVASGKPSPDLFLLAAKELEIEPSKCIVMEDAPNGVVAAKSAGMYCIALTTTVTRENLKGADEIVDKFEEIDVVKLKSL